MRKVVDQVNQVDARASEDVFEAMHAVMHLFRSAQQRGLRDGPHDLAHMEVKTLGFFARHPGATQSDLVLHSGRDKAQVARLIRALRERGLLEAAADELDRRSFRLNLSARGKAAHAALHRNDGRLKDQALRGFSGAEQDTLQDLVARMRANLQDLPD